MSVIYEIQKIKEIIKHPCNMTRKVPFVVNNYNEVLDAWNSYKNNQLFDNNKNIHNIFDFHKSEIDHIILYWSLNQRDCLLMCKIGEKYINMYLPMTLDNLGYSFIATYP